MKRILKAFVYSYDGFKIALKEPAFFQEFILALILIPLACYLEFSLIYKLLIICAHLLTMIVELLNTAVEAAIDRISDERHPLSKIAKDLGSTAVVFSFLILVSCWGFALFA